MTDPRITPEQQRALLAEAASLVGGKRTLARLLGINERSIRALLAGERDLHSGFLRDISRILLDHADACRALERRLSPAFTENLTHAQMAEKAGDGRRYDAKGNAQPNSLLGDRGGGDPADANAGQLWILDGKVHEERPPEWDETFPPGES